MSYSLEASAVASHGLVGQPPSMYSLLLWQETMVRSLYQRTVALSQALAQGLKTSDIIWPKRLRTLLESDRSKFKLGRFPAFIDAVVRLFIASCKVSASYSPLHALPSPNARGGSRLLTIAPDCIQSLSCAARSRLATDSHSQRAVASPFFSFAGARRAPRFDARRQR